MTKVVPYVVAVVPKALMGKECGSRNIGFLNTCSFLNTGTTLPDLDVNVDPPPLPVSRSAGECTPRNSGSCRKSHYDPTRDVNARVDEGAEGIDTHWAGLHDSSLKPIHWTPELVIPECEVNSVRAVVLANNGRVLASHSDTTIIHSLINMACCAESADIFGVRSLSELSVDGYHTIHAIT
ncbi:hypothetical protein L218DRAFT_950543 [Marasmius fiardii PR-910]|nr:hypothetical protein L218DRAFT_950543 [Marasmius fiardii PR-910]